MTELLERLTLNKELYLSLGWGLGHTYEAQSGFVELKLSTVNHIGKFEMRSNKEMNTIVLNALLPTLEK